jgi:hypothetical protein
MTRPARWVRNAIDFCVLVPMGDDHDKKFLALTASGIAALLIIFLVAAQAELGRSALRARDMQMPPAAGWIAAAKPPSCQSCAVP